jgi:hypothetical protein
LFIHFYIHSINTSIYTSTVYSSIQALATLLIPRGAPYRYRLRRPDSRLNFAITSGSSSSPVAVPVYCCYAAVSSQMATTTPTQQQQQQQQQQQKTTPQREEQQSPQSLPTNAEEWSSCSSLMDAQLDATTRRHLQSSVKIQASRRVVQLPKIMAW